MRLAALLLAAAVTLQPQAAQPETKAPVVIRKAAPKYTDEAREAKVQGSVLLQAVIGTDGKAHDIQVLKGLGHGLDESAVDCLRRWRFRPGTRDGVPAPGRGRFEILFRLDVKEPAR